MAFLLDSSFLIDLIREDPRAASKARAIDAAGGDVVLCTPVIFEVTAGFMMTRSRVEAARFRALASRYEVVVFDEASAIQAAAVGLLVETY